MTEIALMLGSALLAFGPIAALFSLIVYHKAQLVIVVTTAALFFLLAATAAGASWWLFAQVIGLTGPLPAILPGIFFQFVFRCAFVSVYHKVEYVIQMTIERQQQQQQEEQAMMAGGGGGGVGRSGTHAAAGSQERPPSSSDRRSDVAAASRRGNHHAKSGPEAAAAAAWNEATLRLQLNDAACGIAAGVGYGGMHVVLLYGTLLASQMRNNVGVLYQDSCPAIPSLVVSAIFAFLFSILDIFWMLFTFFGMRRRLLYHRGDGEYDPTASGGHGNSIGAWFGNSRTGGNLALLMTLATHLASSIFTVADYVQAGCALSLTSVGGLVLITAYVFWAGVGRIYLPPRHQQRNLVLRTMRQERQRVPTDYQGDCLD